MIVKIGDKVNYHSIIDGPVTSTGHMIIDIDYAPNNFGCDVAWITNKVGSIAIRALSHKRIKAFKLSFGHSPAWVMAQDFRDIIEYVTEAEPEECITIEVVWTTEEELKNLPDFDGF